MSRGIVKFLRKLSTLLTLSVDGIAPLNETFVDYIMDHKFYKTEIQKQNEKEPFDRHIEWLFHFHVLSFFSLVYNILYTLNINMLSPHLYAMHQ